MRKLTEQELNSIHARLKRLHIRYTEVYEEVFDHYCTALENVPAIDSPSIMAKLNETFAWSVVKGMEKTIEKVTKQHVSKMQIESFKLWEYDIRNSLSFIITVLLSVLITFFFSKYILSAWIGIVVVAGLVFMFTKDKALLHFNLTPWNKGTVRAVSQIVYSRFIILVGVGISSLLNIQNVKFERIHHQSDFFDIGNLFLLLVLMYSLSLCRIILSRELNAMTKFHSN